MEGRGRGSGSEGDTQRRGRRGGGSDRPTARPVRAGGGRHGVAACAGREQGRGTRGPV
jgi:hypothetical protein